MSGSAQVVQFLYVETKAEVRPANASMTGWLRTGSAPPVASKSIAKQNRNCLRHSASPAGQQVIPNGTDKQMSGMMTT